MDRLVKRTRFHKQKIGRPIYEFFFHRQKICRSVNEFVLISRRSADLLKNLFSYTENRQIYLWFCFHKQKIVTSLSIFCLLWNEFVNRYANWCFIFLIRYIQWTVSFGQNFDNASARNLVMHRPEFWLWPQNSF
jgi:hypothetical protein